MPPVRLLSATVIAVAATVAGCTGSPQTDLAAPSELTGEALADSLQQAGDQAMARGDVRAAAGLYRRAAGQAPQEAAPREALGRALLGLEAPHEAAEAFRGALRIDPLQVDAMRGLGNALLALDQPELAMDWLDQATDLAPADPRVHNARGVALDLMGRHAEARAVYATGLELVPEDLDLRNNLALSHLLTDQPDRAVAILQEVLRDPAATARHRLNLALAYGVQGNLGAAAGLARLELPEADVQRSLAAYQMLAGTRTSAERLRLIRELLHGRGGV